MDSSVKDTRTMSLPAWTETIINHYLAGSYHQFLIDGNIHDFDYCRIYENVNTTDNPSILDIEGFHPIRQILINALFFAMPAQVNIERILYFSRTSGIREINPSEPHLPYAGTLWKMEKKGDKLDSGLSVESEKLPSSSLIPTLYQLDKALKTQWSYTDEDSEKKFQTAVIIDNIEQILPDNISSPGLQSDATERQYYELIHSWGGHRRLHNSGRKKYANLCIMMTENKNLIPASLRCKESGTMPVNVPIPDMSERLRFFNSVAEVTAKQLARDPHAKVEESPIHKFITTPENRKKTAMFTKGFSFVDCDRILAMSNSDPEVCTALLGTDCSDQKILEYFQDQTDDVIKNASKGMLEIVNSAIRFDTIGGLDGAKLYFQRAADAVISDDPMSKEIIPKGVLLAGPPGTGKSLLAKALAQETKLNLVRMGNIRSMWVGESEKNLSLALNLLTSMAPVIVFVDEIDQALGARSSSAGDSGVSGRIFQQILEFMGDNANRGKVIWVAATNRADLIDDALVSRFDRIIPVLLPGSKDEWKSVMEGILKQLNIVYVPEMVDEFIKNDENYVFLNQHSGRSMETVLRFALQKQLESQKKQLSLPDLQTAFEHFKTNINVKVFELQTLLAVASCNDTSFITPPGENGYSYGFKGVDELINTTLKSRNNDSLEQRILLLKSELGHY